MCAPEPKVAATLLNGAREVCHNCATVGRPQFTAATRWGNGGSTSRSSRAGRAGRRTAEVTPRIGDEASGCASASSSAVRASSTWLRFLGLSAPTNAIAKPVSAAARSSASSGVFFTCGLTTGSFERNSAGYPSGADSTASLAASSHFEQLSPPEQIVVKPSVDVRSAWPARPVQQLV